MNTLELRNNAKQHLLAIQNIETGVEYLNKVKAIETWAKAEKKDAELQNIIAEQKLRTQRILGNLLKESNVTKNVGNRFIDGNTLAPSKTLNSIGINKQQSSAFQKIASLPEELFEKEIATAKEETNRRIELTTSRMVQAAKQYEFDQQRIQKAEKIKTVKLSDNILNGDSLEILKTLDDGSIDVVITDPPYGVNYVSNRSKIDNTITKRGLLNDGIEAFKLLDETCKILLDKTADNSHLYFFCSWPVFSKFESIISKYFTIKTPLVWDKKNKGSGDLYNDWGNQTELIIYCVKGNKGLTTRKGNVLSFSRLHTSKMVHPTQKPTELIKELLSASAYKNDFVVDPFMGSGSTIKACNEMNIKSLGIELDKEMFNIANAFINE